MDMAATNANLDAGAYQGHFPPPASINPLTPGVRYAVITVAACGLASFVATLMVFTSLLYRLITWQARTTAALHRSQFVILFLNLVFADLCQSIAFVISWYWYAQDAILAPTAVCTAQGFLINFGDVASAFFVLYIAIHTFFTAARRTRVNHTVFYFIISFAWLLALVLTITGYAMHKERYFVRVAGWCWISHKFEPERLGFHYFWVFFAEFGLLIIYLVIFVQLRRQTSQLYTEQRRASNELANKDTVTAVKRVTKLMMLYPLVYVLLTLPISVCRMWSMAHDGKSVGETTQIIVGALLASCGWVDCCLYSLTRKRLMRETMSRGSGHSAGGSDPHARDVELKSFNHEIVRTNTFEVRSESFDGGSVPPPPGVCTSEVSSGDLRSRARAIAEGEGSVREDRSPSPFNLPEPAYSPQAAEEEVARPLRRKKAFMLRSPI